MSYDPKPNTPNTGQEPYSGYGTPENSYGTPQNPYTPPQNPFAAPQNPYAQPQNPFAGPPPVDTGYQYGYGMPQATPLPLGEALQQLPNQYIKVLTKPGAATFAEEMGKADWGIVWVQLLIYAVIGAVLGFLATITNSGRFNTTTSTGTSTLSPAVLTAITASSSFGSIILIPLTFFIGVGVIYLFAKMFGGQGKFVQQAYTTLLYSVPIGIITSLLGIIPVIGTIGGILGIYGIVLNVFSVMAVHRLGGGKATAAVLLPVGIFFLLICGLFIAFIAILVAATRH